jgi:hypothetical protein
MARIITDSSTYQLSSCRFATSTYAGNIQTQRCNDMLEVQCAIILRLTEKFRIISRYNNRQL